MNFPESLKYSSHDEWILVEGDTITVGITDFAQDALGDLVYVELPEVGSQVSAGDAVCEVESTKATAEIYTPVSGEVVAANAALDASAELINQDPYGQGWIFKVKVADAAGLAGLLDAAAYRARIGK
jgi:glycine cleavage system H protein